MLYQGDIKLFPTANGNQVVFQKGQPIMEQGLGNAVLLSWMLGDNWTNAVSPALGQYNSEVWSILNRYTHNRGDELRLVDAFTDSLGWMIRENLLTEVNVTVTPVSLYSLSVKLELVQPNDNVINIEYSISWDRQKKFTIEEING